MSNPADFFMSMMSIESIELAEIDQNTGSDRIQDTGRIEFEYQKLIEFFDDKYTKSELKSDCEAMH